MDGVEDANAKFRFHYPLYRELFCGCALGVGLDAPKTGYGDWIGGSRYRDLGLRLA